LPFESDESWEQCILDVPPEAASAEPLPFDAAASESEQDRPEQASGSAPAVADEKAVTFTGKNPWRVDTVDAAAPAADAAALPFAPEKPLEDATLDVPREEAVAPALPFDSSAPPAVPAKVSPSVSREKSHEGPDDGFSVIDETLDDSAPGPKHQALPFKKGHSDSPSKSKSNPPSKRRQRARGMTLPFAQLPTELAKDLLGAGANHAEPGPDGAQVRAPRDEAAGASKRSTSSIPPSLVPARSGNSNEAKASGRQSPAEELGIKGYKPRLTLKQFASITAEIALSIGETAAVYQRYHLDAEGYAREKELWARQFEREPKQAERYGKLVRKYRDWLKKQR